MTDKVSQTKNDGQSLTLIVNIQVADIRFFPPDIFRRLTDLKMVPKKLGLIFGNLIILFQCIPYIVFSKY